MEKSYRNCIFNIYNSINNSKKVKNAKNFSYSDLRDKPKGTHELIILQLFLKNEGTYIQLFLNKSQRLKWKQKLNFKIENMRMIRQHEFFKVLLNFVIL